MKPRLVSVDVATRTMTVAFPDGEGAYWTTLVMRSEPTTEGVARTLALAELAALSDAEVELIRETAKPGPRIDILPPNAKLHVVEGEAWIGIATSVRRYTGRVHCPGCGFLLGRASSPHLGYLEECSCCHARLVIAIDEEGATVSFSPTT